MDKIKICIVDDNREIVHIMNEYLNEQDDMEVVGVAYDGKECLTLLEQEEPDVLLLDIIMPHMDGLAVLKTLSEKRHTKKSTHYYVNSIRSRGRHEESSSIWCILFCLKTI